MAPRYPKRQSIASHHNEWMGLVDVSGPFLATGALVRVFPQGLDEVAVELKQRLRLAHEEWLDEARKDAPDPGIHSAFIRYVFREALGFEGRDVAEGQQLPAWSRVPVGQTAGAGETLAPTFALRAPDGKLPLFVMVLEPSQGLERVLPERPWKASPAARMMTLLHGASGRGGPELGLVTNGHAWMLVRAKPGEATSYATFATELFFDEPLTLRAFVSLLGLKRFFNVPDADLLPALFAESAKDQREVTDKLGAQVRRAVEVLIQTIDKLDRGRRGVLLRGIEPSTLYEAAVTVMMRLVFLLAAEERGLLLRGSDLYDQHYAASTLRDQLQTLADRHGEEILERRYDAWARLCATFRAVYGGIEHETLRLPGYGGSLFDPDRFPFLEGRAPGTSFRDPLQTLAVPLAIDSRTVLHLLRAIQELDAGVPGSGEGRRLSFRALDVEQIGHVYEGLLDHTAVRAKGVTVSLAGKAEPEIEIAELEAKRKQGTDVLLSFLAEKTGRTKTALENALAYAPQQDDTRRLLRACENRVDISERTLPWAGLVRRDTHGLPVVLAEGSVFVTEGDERRATGTHYTPRSLTEPIVEHTLAPLVYEGPAEGKPPAAWRLKSPKEILALRVCDLAMGSGAFLVQACRYLADRLVEAWEIAEAREGHELRVAPDGELSIGALGEVLIPPLAPPTGHTALLPGMLVAEGPLFSGGRPAAAADEPAPASSRDSAPPSARGRPSRPPGAKQAREEERLALARRYVADRCLFGVDKNPWAVEMAKLSLWLVTLQKGRAFTFLDHALFAGDSLLGLTSKDQLLAFHLDPVRGREIHALFAPKKFVEGELRRAQELREKIEQFTTSSIVEADYKARMEKEARDAVRDLWLLGDLIVGAALSSNGKGPAFDRTLQNLAEEAIRLLPRDDEPRASAAEDVARTAEREALRVKLAKRARELLDEHRGPGHAARTPFHWAFAFPEVFASGGFDAFVGNPPFQGGQRLTGALGTDYRDLLVTDIAEGRRGSADLCAYFFLRASALLRTPGMAGLLATNTIAQGDTREVGLDALVAHGFTIPRAIPSLRWPGDAHLEVANVWLRRGPWDGTHILGDAPVAGITSQLAVPGRAEGTPCRLRANERKSFIGSYVLGLGFTMSPEDAQALIQDDPRNRDVLFPYLNGQDLNSHPEQRASRWVINFFDWPLDRTNAPEGYSGSVAADYPVCLDIVRRLVKPERDQNPRPQRRNRWWQYAERAPALYQSIRGLPRVLVRALTGKHNAFCFVENGLVVDQTAPAFAFDRSSVFGLLTSSVHGCWALEHGPTLRNDPRYTPSDCFETFPFPIQVESLEVVGERYHAHRAELMRRNEEGLTKTYNRFHDPSQKEAGITKLRALHVELDEAVLRAYDWSDLPLEHGFHETKHGLRFTISEKARVELLDRLLELNHARYAEEVAQGLHPDAKEPAPKTRAASSSDAPAKAKSAATAVKTPRPAAKRTKKGAVSDAQATLGFVAEPPGKGGGETSPPGTMKKRRRG